MYAVSKSLIGVQTIYTKPDTYAVSFEAPGYGICISGFGGQMRIAQDKTGWVVRSISHVRNFAFIVYWHEETSRADNNLASCHARPMLPLFDHSNWKEDGWILYCNSSVCTPTSELAGVLFGETPASTANAPRICKLRHSERILRLCSVS